MNIIFILFERHILAVSVALLDKNSLSSSIDKVVCLIFSKVTVHIFQGI